MRLSELALLGVVAKIRQALVRTLEEVPFVAAVTVRTEPARRGADLAVQVRLPRGRRVELLVEVTSNGQPRVVRSAINQVLRYRAHRPRSYAVIGAPYISPRSAELCVEEGLGYVDLAGNCRLCFAGVFIEVSGRPNPVAERRDLRTLYSPRASRVVRHLLLDPARSWRVQELAAVSQVSIGLVSRVKARLADREWLRFDAAGFGLAEPRHLLEEWAGSYAARQNEIRNYFSLLSVPELEARLVESCEVRDWPYALTGFAGAARLVSAVRYRRVQAFIGAGHEELPQLLDLKPVGSGANLSLLVPYDEGVFAGVRAVDGVRVVAPAQLYLDLKSLRGRGEEAAEELLEQVLEPSW